MWRSQALWKPSSTKNTLSPYMEGQKGKRTRSEKPRTPKSIISRGRSRLQLRHLVAPPLERPCTFPAWALHASKLDVLAAKWVPCYSQHLLDNHVMDGIWDLRERQEKVQEANEPALFFFQSHLEPKVPFHVIPLTLATARGSLGTCTPHQPS